MQSRCSIEEEKPDIRFQLMEAHLCLKTARDDVVS
jgi:hypothetical protein